MKSFLRHFGIAVLFVLIAKAAAAEGVHAVLPLENAHSHNDYRQAHPLQNALEQGFASVEVDVFLLCGQLFVGHEREELRPERTLESLYLTPLADRVRLSGGQVYSQPGRFLLLIDVKTDAEATYERLHQVLAQYAGMLTVIEDGEVRKGPVSVVITGNRPQLDALDAGTRYAGFDGRLSDLDSDAPAHLVPMISDKWTDHFAWEGDGEMPAKEKEKLEAIVREAHTKDRVVRFWATPEKESVWRLLRAAGVDLINTDQLARLAAFLHQVEDVPALQESD